MTAPVSVTLDVLGVAIAVPATLAEAFADLARTDAPSEVAIGAVEPADGLAELTRVAVERSPLLCIHAGVVAGPDGFIAIPGVSGLGKTTLVATLVRAGFEYVSDEALALDRATGQARSFARPLALDGTVWPLLEPLSIVRPRDGVEALVPAQDLGVVAATGGFVREVVLATRRPGPVEIARTNAGEAVSELLRRSFNHYRDPANSFLTVVGVLRQARVWRAGYQEAPELAAELRRLLIQPAVTEPR